MSLSENMFFYFLAFFILAALISYYTSKARRIKQRLKKSPEKKIAEVKVGEYAKICGIVELGEEVLFAPVSERRCAYFRVEIISGTGRDLKVISDKEDFLPFYIRQNNERILVIPDGKNTHLGIDKNLSTDVLSLPKDRLRKYIHSVGIESKGFLSVERSLDYREAVLEEGEQVEVLALVTSQKSKKDEDILALKSADAYPMYIRDYSNAYSHL